MITYSQRKIFLNGERLLESVLHYGVIVALTLRGGTFQVCLHGVL